MKGLVPHPHPKRISKNTYFIKEQFKRTWKNVMKTDKILRQCRDPKGNFPIIKGQKKPAEKNF